MSSLLYQLGNIIGSELKRLTAEKKAYSVLLDFTTQSSGDGITSPVNTLQSALTVANKFYLASINFSYSNEELIQADLVLQDLIRLTITNNAAQPFIFTANLLPDKTRAYKLSIVNSFVVFKNIKFRIPNFTQDVAITEVTKLNYSPIFIQFSTVIFDSCSFQCDIPEDTKIQLPFIISEYSTLIFSNCSLSTSTSVLLFSQQPSVVTISNLVKPENAVEIMSGSKLVQVSTV